MTSAAKTKRGPTVLVTDARDAREAPYRQPSRPSMRQLSSTRLISVDSVLQYASEVPSGQRRGPQTQRPLHHNRTPSGRHPLDPKLAGRAIQNHMPARTSKLSEKLVLLPETEDAEEKGEFDEDEDEAAPPRDEDMKERRRRLPGMKEKSYAERLPKSSRTEKLSRVTAYCTAQAYKMRATAEFVRLKHGARTKLYDDCLYVVYHLPILSNTEQGYRIQSSPVLKNPGGKSVLDEEIERNERHEYREGFFGEERYGVKHPQDGDGTSRHNSLDDTEQGNGQTEQPSPDREGGPGNEGQQTTKPHSAAHEPNESPPATDLQRTNSASRLSANLSNFAELFIYSYGVVVFWNFTERQEKDILADLTFSSSSSSPTHSGTPLAVRPQQEEDFETEEFHFEYNPEITRPRVFNDMITLRSGDHMIKLAMSHAIAQSTKLSFFEERMADTMNEAQSIPRRLALHGGLGMKREEVVRILGRLFMSRVDVNLSSNMLDVPNFFWDSEPTLHPLYFAVREYLEIKPRIQVLNERCRVFLDLAEILSDAIADKKMSRLTWIIIFLIVISILVTASEVFLRFGLLTQGKANGARVGASGGSATVLGLPSSSPAALRPPAIVQNIQPWHSQL